MAQAAIRSKAHSAQPKELCFDQIPSALGQILVVSDGESLCAVDFSDYEARMRQRLEQRFGHVRLVPTSNPQGIGDALQSYLKGNVSSLDELPVSLGGTPFQQQVWLALRTIPVGHVWTYGQLAHQIGRPTAYRAVGMTNALNPIAIVLPCHRVIGANQTLTGYAGGLERKRWLLHHEGVTGY
ncbi:methylated-DNA--[protein]-cysteine S-methyltransferase [Myxacorys almedinensis]|uniref:Methylated-DNA--protein-cysteine methyltransferase n=1 Tax=Myxacorys almedinensis A TaxID=2690445 RepID=A0A8J7Z5P7_9CYAN|nr:methylated-DNA--[protein]-cysteine S-methyltransferase [Myxacorys almedinensis]NDJ15960.1 methylated-DNA--[protein]-cysteine S-methyltransferase [Myxacorys almedinensis A]